MKWIIALIVSCAAMVSHVGCTRLDSDMPSVKTRYRLNIIGEVVQECVKRGINMQKIKSLADLLSVANENGLIPECQYLNREYERDFWDRPFRFIIKTQGIQTLIRIMSDGPDGISQDGKGDDLFIEIELLIERETIIRIKP